MMNLFQTGVFVSHAGNALTWKIDCDALTDDDLECLAEIVAEHIDFSSVIGVLTGGARFANALREYARPTHPPLIVDDVLTTGLSMEELKRSYPDANGVVIFARGRCPDWIWPMFSFAPPWARNQPHDLALAAQPFADYVGNQPVPPDDYIITKGSTMARRQLTMGDCRRVNAILHAYKKRTW